MRNRAFRFLAMGSIRQTREFAAVADKAGFRAVVAHVAEDIDDWLPRDTKDLLSDARRSVAGLSGPPDAILNFGRATVPDGIRRIAEVCEILVRSGCVPWTVKIIGPSERAARTWGDKSLMAKALTDLSLPIPRTLVVGSGQSSAVIAGRVMRGELDLPCVIKPVHLTGGAGMRYAATIESLASAVTELAGCYGSVVVSEFASGDEVSVDVLRLGHRALCYPPGFKGPTDNVLTHADHKIKVNGVVRRIPEFERDVIRIAEAYDLQGFFSLEGVVTGDRPWSWQILEGATRVTNNIQMQDASLGAESFHLVLRYIADEEWLPLEPPQPRLALSIPIYRHREEASVAALAGFEWVRQVKLEDLSMMPSSTDRRVRLTVKMDAENLAAKLPVLAEATGDSEVPARVRAEVERVCRRYGR